jgi:hypothetical protein
MRVIYKYPLNSGVEYEEMPEGEVVAVAFQNGWPYVWINHELNTIHRMTLCVLMTGEEFEDTSMSHVGSCISDTFVLHVYRKY